MSWFNRLAAGAAVSVLASAIAAPAMAQETTSSVRGAVTSVDGSPIGGVEVTVVHEPTGARSVEATGSDGLFDLRGLRVGGPYTLEFNAPEFRGERVENVFLEVGQPFRLTVDLEPAPVDQVIVVTAPPRAGVDVVGSSTRLGRDDIEAVVSVNRDIRDLARQDPLVTQNNRGDGGISIAGSNPRTNRITIGGVQAQDDFGLNTGGFPTRRGPVSLDAIGQFSVEAVPFDVENGDFLGGAINIVLAGGGNDFRGSVFTNYLNDGLVGTRIRGQQINIARSQTNYGGTLRGPIWPGHVFFALSYENFESVQGIARGPSGQGFLQGYNGLTGTPNALGQTEIDAVTNVFRNTYGSQFPFGTVPKFTPITDEKYSAQIDWDITDDHRATFTYRFAESGVIQETNTSATSVGLDSQWYLTGEEDTSYALQINSDWTDDLSTELRISRREYARAQMPPAGQNFADIRVCVSPTAADTGGQDPTLNCRATNNSSAVSVVRFGPDQFRHANELETANDQLQFSGEYELGAHLLKAGYQFQRTEVYNLFLPQSDGVYYFDSIADFAAGRANELVYRNALTGDPTDAAAVFDYDVHTLFLQDSWDISDAWNLSAGVRWDTYRVTDKPVLNPNFTNRYGFNNQETYDERDVLMPRLSFRYRPDSPLEVSGGVGLFSGGVPDVFLSNSFSNTGFIDNTLTFRRLPGNVLTETSGAVNCTLQAAVCNAALNVPVNAQFGGSIPASVQAALGGTVVSPASETNSLARDFEMPADWRANVSLSYEFAGWELGLDVVGVRAQEEIAFRDIRSVPLLINGARATTPDGRLRYDGLTTAQRTSVAGVSTVPTNIPVGSNGQISSNRDIQVYNPAAESYSVTAAVSVGREWDNGLGLRFAYAYQDLESFSGSARFSSTASSLYGGQFASRDPNTATRGTGFDEIEHSFKANVSWRRQFFGDLETRFQLFGETRTGRPVSFVMSGGAGRNATFGVNRGGQLAYIPDLSNLTTSTLAGGVAIASDSKVVFDNAATLNALVGWVNQFGLPQGGIAPVGVYQNDGVTQLDLNISQELPVAFDGHRMLLDFQIANFLNMLNDDWGTVEELGDTQTLFNVSCAGADGVADNDGVVTCQRYRISGVPTSFTVNRNVDESLWFMQIGLRYQW